MKNPISAPLRPVLLCSLFVYATLTSVGCSSGTNTAGSSESQSNPVPALSAISPATLSAGSGGLTLTATGSNFVAASVVEWNGSSLATTYVSGTSLQATVPASDVSAAGSASVTVMSPAPGGGSSQALSLTITAPANPAPVLESLSPASGVAGSPAFSLTVSGSGFVNGSQVQWNGSARTTAFVSSTQLTASISAVDIAAEGSANVTVSSPAPGGGTSASLSFAIAAPPNPVPAISSIAPASAVAGGSAFGLTVTGTGFLAASQVLWNGSTRTTTFVSSTQLTAAIGAADIGSAGSAAITVANPAPGGGTSGAVAFAIAAPTATSLTVLNVEGYDLAWDASQKKMYVSIPSGAAANGNSITVVDPVAGTIGNSQASGIGPHVLGLSDDDQYLYVTLDGEQSIQRFTLPGLTPDIKFKLGTDPLFGYQLTPEDIKVQPGAAHTVGVVTTAANPSNPAGTSVVVYDDAVERAGAASTAGGDFISLQWKQDGSQIYVDDASSGGQFYTIGVGQSGASVLTTYYGAFQFPGFSLLYDPATSYLYSAAGEVANAATGLPIGEFGAPQATSPAGASSAIDPTLQRLYVLTSVWESFTAHDFQIQVYDMKHFTLLGTFLIPNAVGNPSRLIRWGTSGLAFVTNEVGSSTPTAGELYLLDGAFVNPTGGMDTTVGTQMNPAPTLTALSPLMTTVNSGGVTLTVSGMNFAGQPTVAWNGVALPTTMVNAGEVSAVVPASDLTASTQAAITVTNGAPGGGVSNVLYFGVGAPVAAGNQVSVYPTGGLDVAWDKTQQKLYVSMPGVQGALGNRIASVDPAMGTVATTGFIGSDPTKLSISDDDQYLYVGLDGQNAVRRLVLPALTPDIAWGLGSDSFFGAYRALDLKVAPGLPHTAAITLYNCCSISPSSAGVTIFDDGVARSVVAGVTIHPYYSIQWKSDASALYASEQEEPTGLSVLAVNAAGVSLSQYFADALSNPVTADLAIHYDGGTGHLYADSGLVVNPADGTTLGNFHATGLALPDSSTNQVFFLGQTNAQLGTRNYTVESFDQTKFTAIGSMIVPNVVGKPTGFIRWGNEGLAFTTIAAPLYTGALSSGPGQLYVISGSLVNPAATGNAQPTSIPAQNVRKTWRSVGDPVDAKKP